MLPCGQARQAEVTLRSLCEVREWGQCEFGLHRLKCARILLVGRESSPTVIRPPRKKGKNLAAIVFPALYQPGTRSVGRGEGRRSDIRMTGTRRQPRRRRRRSRRTELPFEAAAAAAAAAATGRAESC